VEEAAEVIKPARDELIRQAAQGEVLHNDMQGWKDERQKPAMAAQKVVESWA